MLNPDLDPDSSNPWDWINLADTARFGPAFADPEERRRWSNIMLTGGLPMLWRKTVRSVRDKIFAKMELKRGDNVFLIGEGLELCGFVDEIRSHIGPEGRIKAVELIEEARDATLGLRYGRGGQLGSWQWHYSDEDPDSSYDCVACLQGVQHTDDWRETAAEFTRIVKPGGMVVLGELTIGPTFRKGVEMDVHLEYWIEKLFYGAGMKGISLAYYSPEELLTAFNGLLDEQEIFEWRGVECFWGRKPAAT